MKIVTKKINDLISAEYNPRKISKVQKQDLTDSLKRFGLVDPIIINKNNDRKNIVIGGHQRLQIWKELGNTEIQCNELDLSLEKEKELNIRLNKNGGDFDNDLIKEYFDYEELTDWGFTPEELFDFENNKSEDEYDYTKKINIPKYEAKNEKPEIENIYNKHKSDDLINKINQSNISDEEKKFLTYAALRHIVFDFEKIADFYSHSNKEMQELMEDSALVVVDFNKALEDGYIELNQELIKLYKEENDE